MRIKTFSYIFFFSLLFLQPVLAKSYSYNYVKTNLDFYIDGSIIVRQERDYDFKGSFTYAYLDVLKKDVKDVKFIGIVDLDTNESLAYALQDDSTHVKATWYYTANDQVKRFLIIYKIEGAVKRYEDVAEFYWKVIEDEHENIEKFESYVNLPTKSPNLFKVFVHSSASPGKIDFLNDLQTAKVTMQSIPTNTFVEFRILTEPPLFTGVQQINQSMYQEILNQESINFQSSSITSSVFFYILIVIIVPILIFLYFYLKYGREPKLDYQLEYEQEPPMDIPPMALSALYGRNKNTSAPGLLATIFDLARRGYIDIREEKKERMLGLFDKNEQIFKITKKGKSALSPRSELLKFERDTLGLLFKDIGKGKSEVSSSEMAAWSRRNNYKMLDKITKISDNAKEWFEKTYFKIYEPQSLRASSKFLGVIIAYFVIAFAFLFYFKLVPMDFSLIFFPIIFITIIIAATHAINKRTPQAALEIKRWSAFKKYITDFSVMKDAPTTLLHIWDRYLIYAVVLGVAKKLLENVRDLSLDRHAKVVAVAWYHPIGTLGIPTGMMSPEAFTAFSSNMNGMINALSSSSSVGGGFSGGGGGGGGGGGSGAG